VLVERRSEHPMLDLTLFSKPAFDGASVAAFALSASMFSMFLYLTLYIQNGLGYTPFQTGLRFLPLTVVSFFVAPLGGRLSSKLPPRLLMSAGLALVAVALFLMHGVKTTSSWTTLLPGFVLAGIGLGVLNPMLAQTAIGVVPPARSGMASGINNTFRQVGVATGIAGLGALFQHQVQSHVASLIAGTPAAAFAASHSEAVRQLASGGGGALSQAPPVVKQQLAHAGGLAFVDGFNYILIVAAIIAAVGAVLAFVLIRRSDFVESRAAVAEATA
jgi:predicted MFS family arabinose efflux permease